METTGRLGPQAMKFINQVAQGFDDARPFCINAMRNSLMLHQARQFRATQCYVLQGEMANVPSGRFNDLDNMEALDPDIEPAEIARVLDKDGEEEDTDEEDDHFNMTQDGDLLGLTEQRPLSTWGMCKIFKAKRNEHIASLAAGLTTTVTRPKVSAPILITDDDIECESDAETVTDEEGREKGTIADELDDDDELKFNYSPSIGRCVQCCLNFGKGQSTSSSSCRRASGQCKCCCCKSRRFYERQLLQEARLTDQRIGFQRNLDVDLSSD